MSVTEESLDRIRDGLRQWGGKQIPGTAVRDVITAHAPEVDLRAAVDIPAGPGALTKFVSTYLSGVLVRVGKAGSDNLYEIQGETPATSHEFWQAFVSPQSENVVGVQPE